tara:strand:+ start:791 stop:907 length:117 start_codon:yes stop_codon:yes gene_type:complete
VKIQNVTAKIVHVINVFAMELRNALALLNLEVVVATAD